MSTYLDNELHSSTELFSWKKYSTCVIQIMLLFKHRFVCIVQIFTTGAPIDNVSVKASWISAVHADRWVAIVAIHMNSNYVFFSRSGHSLICIESWISPKKIGTTKRFPQPKYKFCFDKDVQMQSELSELAKWRFSRSTYWIPIETGQNLHFFRIPSIDLYLYLITHFGGN